MTFDAVVKNINNIDELGENLKTMPSLEIQNIYQSFEDPYSNFNIDKDYDPNYWIKWKEAVLIFRPEVTLFPGRP